MSDMTVVGIIVVTVGFAVFWVGIMCLIDVWLEKIYGY